MRLSKLKARWLKVTSIAGVLLFLAPWVYIRLATPATPEVLFPPVPPDSYQNVYCEIRSYHTALFIEQPAGWRLGPEGQEEAPFVEYNWGNRSFYMESNFWPHAVLAALFLPGQSVVYIRAHDAAPKPLAEPAQDVYQARLSAEEFARLVRALEQAFLREGTGSRPPAFPPVEGYAGRFYPGREYYIFWQNCNDWVVRMLEESNNGGDPSWIVFSNQVPGGLDGRWRRLEQ